MLTKFSRFGDHLTRLSGPGNGQWVAKTHPMTLYVLFSTYFSDLLVIKATLV